VLVMSCDGRCRRRDARHCCALIIATLSCALMRLPQSSCTPRCSCPRCHSPVLCSFSSLPSSGTLANHDSLPSIRSCWDFVAPMRAVIAHPNQAACRDTTPPLFPPTRKGALSALRGPRSRRNQSSPGIRLTGSSLRSSARSNTFT
jgi:hypothetical protein